jgi:hypothetical protein
LKPLGQKWTEEKRKKGEFYALFSRDFVFPCYLCFFPPSSSRIFPFQATKMAGVKILSYLLYQVENCPLVILKKLAFLAAWYGKCSGDTMWPSIWGT